MFRINRAYMSIYTRLPLEIWSAAGPIGCMMFVEHSKLTVYRTCTYTFPALKQGGTKIRKICTITCVMTSYVTTFICPNAASHVLQATLTSTD